MKVFVLSLKRSGEGQVKGMGATETADPVVAVRKPYRLVSRDFHPDDSVIRVGDVAVGGSKVIVMSGPCSVESREQVLASAEFMARIGVPIMRGGAYKPRTSPYSFQGMGIEGLELLAEARERFGVLTVTEAVDKESLDEVVKWADIVQIGARNMQNFALLRAVGQTGKPVLLKRGLAATIDEWLMAAEYVAANGNPNIILCERGIRTYETKTRNTLDISAVPVVKQLSHLPVIIDPSHAAGQWQWVAPLARAGIAAGADGLIIETHPNPAEALSDGPQSLNFPHMEELMGEIGSVARAIGRDL
jgi:3-deoxy-7-phosphoheptulonate synthase